MKLDEFTSKDKRPLEERLKSEDHDTAVVAIDEALLLVKIIDEYSGVYRVNKFDEIAKKSKFLTDNYEKFRVGGDQELRRDTPNIVIDKIFRTIYEGKLTQYHALSDETKNYLRGYYADFYQRPVPRNIPPAPKKKDISTKFPEVVLKAAQSAKPAALELMVSDAINYVVAHRNGTLASDEKTDDRMRYLLKTHFPRQYAESHIPVSRTRKLNLISHEMTQDNLYRLVEAQYDACVNELQKRNS